MLKKKILAVLTIMVMLVSMIPVNVINATETLQTNFSLYLYPLIEENQMFVGIQLNTQSDFAAANFELEYNTDAFTYASGSALPEMENGTNIIKNNSSEGIVKMAYMANPEDEDHTKKGGLYGFYFDINDNYSGEVSFVITNPLMKRRDGVSFEKKRHEAKMTLSGNNPLESISLDNTSLSLTEGEKATLSVIYNPDNTTEDKTVSWGSTDETVATVDSNGVVTAISQGKAEIVAVVGNKTATCEVTVNKQEIALTSISLNKTEETLVVGQTDTLNVTYNPENTTEDITLSWGSSNEEVATVVDGVVTTHKSGTAVITANANGKTASCTYEVKDIELESIALSDASATIEKGATKDLTVMYNPENTTVDKSVSWTTSDASVATVNENGTVTAVGNGTATITATVNGKTATCDITVKTTLQAISLNKTNSTIIKGENDTLEVTLNPVDATITQNVEWTSSNNEIAIVSNGVVTAKGTGTTTVTASIGSMTATCEVTVVDIELDSIKLNKNTTEINKGESDTLIVSYNPENTTVDRTIIWSSSNEDVATVENGVITAKKAGTTLIIATVGDKVDTCTVRVVVPLESISLNKTETTIAKGNTETLVVTRHPDDTTNNEDVLWSSADETIATVENGVVTPKSNGTTTITAKVGDKTATCEVTVVTPLDSISISKATITIIKNSSEKLELKYSPEDATITGDIEWTSLNTRIATVVDGIVTGRKAGTVTIVATVDGKVATCDVTVEEIALEDIKLDVEKAEIDKGYSRKLEVEYIPENTTIDKDVIWTSSDETVAIVNDDGIVTALKPGKAVITATIGGKTKSVEITVPEVHLTDAYIIYDLVKIKVEDMLQLYISTEPEISTVTDEINCVWMSEDESIATVDEFGMVTAKGVGETRISLVVNGIFESYVTVVVEETPVQENTEDSTIVTAEETVPPTGDIAVIAIVVIAIISIAGIIFVIVKNKKRKQ